MAEHRLKVCERSSRSPVAERRRSHFVIPYESQIIEGFTEHLWCSSVRSKTQSFHPISVNFVIENRNTIHNSIVCHSVGIPNNRGLHRTSLMFLSALKNTIISPHLHELCDIKYSQFPHRFLANEFRQLCSLENIKKIKKSLRIKIIRIHKNK